MQNRQLSTTAELPQRVVVSRIEVGGGGLGAFRAPGENINDARRSKASDNLSRSRESRLLSGAAKYVVPLIEVAWPREARVQTERITHAWWLMLEETEEEFADVLNSRKPSFVR